MREAPRATEITRPVVEKVTGLAARDGAGVRLTRVIGQPRLDMLDPFLLLDAFGSDQPDDYIGGFPAHPHRGFETVTYLLAGRMRHEDSAGHAGVIEAGGVQWMSAARGIVHAEMPEQEDGLLAGFQLWINLPSRLKMSAPRYQEFAAGEIPTESRDDGATIKVIAGTSSQGTRGPVREVPTKPIYFDVALESGATIGEPLPPEHNAFVYVIEGEVRVARASTVPAGTLAVLGSGSKVDLEAAGEASRLLLVAGRPLGEPVARGGPFVMNSRAEVLQAFRDYESDRL